MAYKVYIATPINNRPEENIELRLIGARKRIDLIRYKFTFDSGRFECDNNGHFQHNAIMYSTFGINSPCFLQRSEAECLANCVRLIMECDAIIIDKGLGIPSKGMAVEEFVARTYGKTIIYYNHKD